MRPYGTTEPDEAQSEELVKRHRTTIRGAFPNSPIYKQQYNVNGAGASYPLYNALLNNTIAGGEWATDHEGSVFTEEGILSVSEVPDTDLEQEGHQPDIDHPKTQAMVHWGFNSVNKTGLDYTCEALDPTGGGDAPSFAFAPNLNPPSVARGKGAFTATDDNSASVWPVFDATKLMPLQPHQTQARVSRTQRPILRPDGKVAALPAGLTKVNQAPSVE